MVEAEREGESVRGQMKESACVGKCVSECEKERGGKEREGERESVGEVPTFLFQVSSS